MDGTGSSAIREGDRILLLEAETGHRFLILADGKGARKERGLGVVDPARFVGTPWGSAHVVGQKRLVALRPHIEDLSSTLARKAQVILPKDASRIVFDLGIGPGMRVFESGIGSGAATMALAWAVAPGGRVVVQELRQDFADWSRDNLERAGLGEHVEIHLGDTLQGLAPGVQGPFEAALLDLPEPWTAIPHLVPQLAAGASVACYTPHVSQMEATHKAFVAAGFAAVRSLELIEREWEVKERGSRPSFGGLGHTAFLTFGRWLGHPAAPPAAAPRATTP